MARRFIAQSGPVLDRLIKTWELEDSLRIAQLELELAERGEDCDRIARAEQRVAYTQTRLDVARGQ